MPLEVAQMETPALHAAKQERWEKARKIVDGVKARIGSDADPYDHFSGDERTSYKAFMEDAQILETEIGARAEKDAMRAFGRAAAAPTQLAAMLGTEGQPEGGDNGDEPIMTPGLKFVSSAIYQKLLKDGAFAHEPNSGNIPEFAVELGRKSSFAVHRRLMKAAERWEKSVIHTGASSGGAFVLPEYQMDVEPAARPTPDVLALLPVQRTAADTIYWMRQDTRSTAATSVSQATAVTGTLGTKPESTMAWSRQSTSVQTIAVWVPVTNQQLADAPEIRGVIDGELQSDLDLQLDYQVLSGGGTAPDLGGILNASIQSIAYSSATGWNIADYFLRASIAIMTANEPNPSGAVMNPIQYYLFATMKATGSGEYLSGSPTTGGPRTIFGMTLAVSNRLASQTGLVGYFPAARLHMREDANIKVGFANDDFINNRVRLLAELRAALTVRRPNAFCKITSLPTS